jgi:hypothetical protein
MFHNNYYFLTFTYRSQVTRNIIYPVLTGYPESYDMNITDSKVALMRGLETVTVAVAKCPQCGVVGVTLLI